MVKPDPAEVRPRALALAGPTASGKTAAALAIAQELPVEIISVDSALVYRGMDIGTAKPSPQELAAVAHHLIDIREANQSYSAADFARDATRLMREIHQRGRLPLLVGGTMLYFKALVDGLDELPQADARLRAEIDAQARAEGWPALHAELARVDPVTAQRLAPMDAQRIQRAMEVYRITGRPLSSLYAPKNEANSSIPTMGKSGFFMTLLALEPQERAWLHARIAERFDAMLAAGLVEEVRQLRARGDLHAGLPSMRCVGYRQVWEALEALPTPDAPLAGAALEAVRERGIAATRQLAKRQLTWLRSMPQRQVVACDAPNALAHVVELARNFAGGSACG